MLSDLLISSLIHLCAAGQIDVSAEVQWSLEGDCHNGVVHTADSPSGTSHVTQRFNVTDLRAVIKQLCKIKSLAEEGLNKPIRKTAALPFPMTKV